MRLAVSLSALLACGALLWSLCGVRPRARRPSRPVPTPMVAARALPLPEAAMTTTPRAAPSSDDSQGVEAPLAGQDPAEARRAMQAIALNPRRDPELRVDCIRRLAADPRSGRLPWLKYMAEHGDRPEVARAARSALAQRGGVR